MCRRTGAYSGNTYGSGTGQIWLDDLECTGNEMSLINCTHRGWGVSNCDHSEDVSIVCGDGTLYTMVGLLDVVSEYETQCDDESQGNGSVNCQDQFVQKWILNINLSMKFSNLI